MNRTKTLMMSLIAAAVLGLGATAQAQDTPPPSEPPPPPPPAHRSSGSLDLSGGAGIGVGAAATLTGLNTTIAPAGLFVYDAALFHIEGMLGFYSAEAGGGERASQYVFGAGGWYHLHRGSSSDFSLGALIAIGTTSGPGPSSTVTAFEPGATARAFITPNVAFFGRVGLAFLFGDTGNGTNIGLGGLPTGAFGFTYFFR